jgi:hypothetical protein
VTRQLGRPQLKTSPLGEATLILSNNRELFLLEEKITVQKILFNIYLFILRTQEFMQAKQAASFYIKIVCFDDLREVLAPLSLQNIQTGEKLVITKIMGEHPRDVNLTISRIPIGANEEEWHNEMAQYSDSNSDNRWDNVGQYAKKEYRNIVIDI